MAKIDKGSFHKEHHSRNLGLLTEEEQQKPPDIKEIMADYDKAVKFFANTPAEAW